MTETDRQLLKDLAHVKITYDQFLNYFSVDIKKDSEFVRKEMKTAIETDDPNEIGMTLPLIWLSGNIPKYIDILNELLINPHHRKHQEIAKHLQDYPSPATVPFVRKVLESKFDFLEYTCSDSDAIAKWFSWLLYSIGTTEAIDLMKEYSNSSDDGIREEMLYRLKKIQV